MGLPQDSSLPAGAAKHNPFLALAESVRSV